MSNWKFIILASLAIVVLFPLIVIDWIVIAHVTSFIIPIEGVQRLILSALFIIAITVVPVFGVVPKLSERIRDNRFKRWTGKPVDKTGDGLMGLGLFLFVLAAIVFLIMSINTPNRFIIAQENPVADIFSGLEMPSVVGSLVDNLTGQGPENAKLASWIMGLEPFFTTLLSSTLYFLVAMDKKKECLEKEIAACKKKISSIEKEKSEIDSEIVLLNNISVYIDEIQHHIEDYKEAGTAFKERNINEQLNEKNLANEMLMSQSWISFNKFFELGREKFKPAIKRDLGKERLNRWLSFREESEAKIKSSINRKVSGGIKDGSR